MSASRSISIWRAINCRRTHYFAGRKKKDGRKGTKPIYNNHTPPRLFNRASHIDVCHIDQRIDTRTHEGTRVPKGSERLSKQPRTTCACVRLQSRSTRLTMRDPLRNRYVYTHPHDRIDRRLSRKGSRLFPRTCVLQRDRARRQRILRGSFERPD